MAAALFRLATPTNALTLKTQLSELGSRLEDRSLDLIDWLLPQSLLHERFMNCPDCCSARTTRPL